MSLEIDLQHHFGAFSLDVAFESKGGVTAIFGRSGSGKTSVVNAVAGLLRPDRGRIRLGETVLFDSDLGIWLPPHRRRIGYVFQEGRLFPHLDVRGNLLFGSRFAASRPSSNAFGHLVELLGISDLLRRKPSSLSGGERQRVAIGRALLSSPALLAMDEPLASLDEARKQEILPYLERLRDETDIPILYISHSIGEVARLANRIVLLRSGQVAVSGTVADVLTDPDAVPLLGVRYAGAFIEAEAVEHHTDDGLTELWIRGGKLLVPAIDAPRGTRIRLRIEAHDVIIARERPTGISPLNILPAKITAIRLGEGPGAAVRLDIGGDPLLARITRRSVRELGLEKGQSCFAILKATSVAQSDVGQEFPTGTAMTGM